MIKAVGIHLSWVCNTTKLKNIGCLIVIEADGNLPQLDIQHNSHNVQQMTYIVKNLLVSSIGSATLNNDGSKAKGNQLQLDIPEI
jgi:hypothetical protein